MQHKIRREQFRSLLRKEQILAQFERRRKQCFYPSFSTEPNPAINDANNFNELLNNIISCLKQGSEVAIQGLAKIQYALNNQNDKITTLIFGYDQMFRSIIEIIIQNRAQQSQMKQCLMRQDLNYQLMKRLLCILNIMNYSVLDQKSFQNILHGFWLIFTQNIINLNEQRGLLLKESALQILIKMLQPSSQIVYQSLKKIGINQKFINFMNFISVLNNNRLNQILLTIMYLFLQQEKDFQDEEAIVCRVNGVYLDNDQSRLKENQLAFALSMIDSQIINIISKSLNIITIIIQKFEYFAHSIKVEQFRKIRDYMEFPNDHEKEVQLRAMQAIDVIVLANVQIFSQVTQEQKLKIQNNQLQVNQRQIACFHFVKFLDILDKQLRKQMYQQDKNTKKVTELGAVILCNLTFIKKNIELRQKLIYHKIWDLAYNSIANGHSLLCLVTTFQFLFDITPRKKILDISKSFIASISQLQKKITDQRFLKSIQNTLCRLFYLFKDHFDKNYLEVFVHQIRNNHAQSYLQEQLNQYYQENPL